MGKDTQSRQGDYRHSANRKYADQHQQAHVATAWVDGCIAQVPSVGSPTAVDAHSQ